MPRLTAEDCTPAEQTVADDSRISLWITTSGAVKTWSPALGRLPSPIKTSESRKAVFPHSKSASFSFLEELCYSPTTDV